MTPLFHFFFFFNDTATTEIYTLSLHDALPISRRYSSFASVQLRSGSRQRARISQGECEWEPGRQMPRVPRGPRSEEHTSELQSRQYLVCRLLLEKKKQSDKIKP